MGKREEIAVPTYIFPADPVTAIRSRFSDPNAGARDGEYAQGTGNCYEVTWNDLSKAKCPAPPKSCSVYYGVYCKSQC